MQLNTNDIVAMNRLMPNRIGETAEVNTFISQSGTVVGCLSLISANLANIKLMDAITISSISIGAFIARLGWLFFDFPKKRVFLYKFFQNLLPNVCPDLASLK